MYQFEKVTFLLYDHLMKKAEAAQGEDTKSCDQNLVTSFNNFPKLCLDK